MQRSLLLLIVCMTLAVASCTKAPPPISHKVPPKPEIVEPPTKPLLTKMELWKQLVHKNRYTPNDEKLAMVNLFFNGFEFIDDKYLWGKEDYWATLFETLTMSGGDCEDLTIAKYFTLKYLHIPEQNMRLTYVISGKTKNSHMVLTCQLNSEQEPLVLDTLNNYIFPVSQRPDLVPVYSFNMRGYWLARKEEGWNGERIGSPTRLSLWWNLLTRMKMSQSKELYPVENYYR